MDISFGSSKLQKTCNDSKKARREWGERRAKLVRVRLDDLQAADNLGVMRSIPQARCHELGANRAGQLAVDLDHPYRLIFEPAHDPLPEEEDGGLDWHRVTAITILEITDYHG